MHSATVGWWESTRKHFWGTSNYANKKELEGIKGAKSWSEIAKDLGNTVIEEAPAFLAMSFFCQWQAAHLEAQKHHKIEENESAGVGVNASTIGFIGGATVWFLQRTIVSAGKAMGNLGNAGHWKTFNLHLWGHKPETKGGEEVISVADLEKTWTEFFADAGKGAAMKFLPSAVNVATSQSILIGILAQQAGHDPSATAVFGATLLATMSGVSFGAIADVIERAFVAAGLGAKDADACCGSKYTTI